MHRQHVFVSYEWYCPIAKDSDALLGSVIRGREHGADEIMDGFEVIEPLIGETWVVDGRVAVSPPGDTDALYIRPMLHERGMVPSGTKVLHSLVLDNNVLSDMTQCRRSANIDYLISLLRSKPLELNPTMAMLEQRQGFVGASQALHDFAELLGKRFGAWDAKKNASSFDKALEDAKSGLAENVTLLSGYLPAILYLYHQAGSAEYKLEWLSGLVRSVDLPFLQLPFYLAALLFLAKEEPALFRKKVLVKVRKDTKLMPSLDRQKKSILNLGHDVMLPAAALFPANTQGTMVFPYIATRDYLLQDFLAEVRCGAVVMQQNGGANGAWELNPGGRLHEKLGAAIARCLPHREHPGSETEKSIRRGNLRAFSDSYLEKCVALKHTAPP
ncbi:hypothetical protein [Chromohalobacter israelensis]|uniref:Uncharacterized protein n=1 Tax=Chromohalobacter israelensis (strain ATCC BAA-138 / DSM 3043 / CIP 106854 / NCIMB 13768 / 1H11) TaxID=290398 RepID=Q1QZL1_CHRI1|nr:hypothetical protein [Chromohalobacter salexigens]ABE58097.1 hypothetical protein Csal_0739 [Chromohalobacter salexigens DSM 3043]